MTLTLRPYQRTGIDAIRAEFARGKRRVLYTLPTGGGKTVMFCWLAKQVSRRGKRVVILVHREELLDQVSAALSLTATPHGLIKAGRPARNAEPVQVASVFSLARRLSTLAPPDMIVCDEAHHMAAGSWARIVAHYPQAWSLGVTATPCRLDGRGLGNHYDTLVAGPSVESLISDGWLVPPVVYAPQTVSLDGVRTTGGDYNRGDLVDLLDRPHLYGDVIKHWRSLASDLPTVAFCVSVSHARATAATFRRVGIEAESIDGEMDGAQRARIVGDFRSGRITVLASCDLISEGFDLPGIHAAILLRPTKSLGLYLQQVGRALRPATGKTQAVIIDHAGNCLRHGLPNETRDWTLTTDRATRTALQPIKQCPTCYGIYPAHMRACPNCGAETATEVKRPITHDERAELRRVEAEELARYRNMRYADAVRSGRTLAELRKIARARGYHTRWALRILQERVKRS